MTVRRRDLLTAAGLCSVGRAARAEGHELERLSDGTSGRIVEIRGSDGTSLPAYLRTPAGPPPFAVVVVLHGGPADVEGTYSLGRTTNPPTGIS